MFRFTIRDVLWLMLLVGVIAGWAMEHRQHVLLQRMKINQTNTMFAQLVFGLEKLGFKVDMTTDSMTIHDQGGKQQTVSTLPPP